MVLQHSSMGKSLLWHISYNFAQCQSRGFPIKLCCNTIIHLLFHYFLLHRSLLHFKINNFLKYLDRLIDCWLSKTSSCHHICTQCKPTITFYIVIYERKINCKICNATNTVFTLGVVTLKPRCNHTVAWPGVHLYLFISM